MEIGKPLRRVVSEPLVDPVPPREEPVAPKEEPVPVPKEEPVRVGS